MENTIETNEPVTIKITIEVIPAKKKENIKEEMVVVKHSLASGCSETITPPKAVGIPEGWNEIEPESPTVVPSVEPVVAPEKKKRAYTPRKTKDVVPVVVEEKNPEEVIKPDITVKFPTTSTTNKVVARLAQMIRFYCKASGIETSTITIAHLKEKAFDIVENVADDVITEAIKEASGK